MANFEKDQKKTREANWIPAEKEYLRQCVSMHLDIVENRGNDATMIAKKNSSWKAIREAMIYAGYNRDVCKLKAQWVRMKVNTRKAVARIKRASASTDYSNPIPELSTEEKLVQSMIAHELEDDEILIESKCWFPEINIIESSDDEKKIEEHSSKSQQTVVDEFNKTNFSPTNTPKIYKKYGFSSPRKQHRSFPKTPLRNIVILERQRQISKETSNSEEIFKLQKHQLTTQIEHQQRMNKLEEEQAKELHALKLFYEAELHALKLKKY